MVYFVKVMDVSVHFIKFISPTQPLATKLIV